jgi:hypothetical protein
MITQITPHGFRCAGSGLPRFTTQKPLCSLCLCGENNQFILCSLCLCGELFSRPWVGFVVNAGEMLEIEVGIDLRRAQIGMSQQLLYCTQIFG